MAFEFALGNVLNAAGGLVVVGFGAFVAIVARRAPAATAFVTFAVGFGSAVTFRNVAGMAVSFPDLMFGFIVLGSLFWLVATFGLLRLGLTFPSPIARPERRLLILPVIAFAANLLVALWILTPFQEAIGSGSLFDALVLIYTAAGAVGAGAFVALLVLLALRTPRATAGDRSQLTLLSVALLPYIAYWAGASAVIPNSAIRAVGYLWVASLLAVTVLWLSVSADGALPRKARNLALLGPAMMLVGGVEVVFFGLSFGPNSVSGTSGILRIFSVAVLAYAVVRHHLLGLDVKVRFAISKSTIAAIFMAVFFVASEATQQFFGDQFQSGYVGILLAGTLVFAFAPLSRLADRIAEKAVPVAVSLAPASAAENEEAYRNALRLALRDRALTRDEERQLLDLARSLHIDGHRAHELLVEVERAATR